MMKVSCLVFLTFTLVLSHQDVIKRGGVGSKRGLQEVTIKSTKQALAYLMKAGKAIPSGVIVSHSCEWLEMRPLFRHKLGGYVCKFNGDTTCYATGTVDKEVRLYSKNYEQENVPAGSEQCANQLKFQAIYLRYIEGGDSYTFLDPSTAPWFFTTPLMGCDVFVATETNQGDRPLVIHSNRNLIKGTVVDKLRAKENFVKVLLKRLQNRYKVIARVYMMSRFDEENRQRAIDDYMGQYLKRNPGVKLIPYDERVSRSEDQFTQFIGHYHEPIITWPLRLGGRWQFITKGEITGKTTEFSV